MYVCEYLKLKRNKQYLYNSVRLAKDGSEKKAALQKQYNLICHNIELGEKTKPIKEYLEALKKRSKMRIQLKVWTYYKKNVSVLKKSIDELEKSIEAMEKLQPATPTKLKAAPKKDKSKNITKTQQVALNPSIEPYYYIIILAGSIKVNSNLVDVIQKYINENGRNLLESSDTIDEERKTFNKYWKFQIQTIEDQSNIMALRDSAEYLLDALKSWVDSNAEMEIYGKSQKY